MYIYIYIPKILVKRKINTSIFQTTLPHTHTHTYARAHLKENISRHTFAYTERLKLYVKPETTSTHTHSHTHKTYHISIANVG